MLRARPLERGVGNLEPIDLRQQFGAGGATSIDVASLVGDISSSLGGSVQRSGKWGRAKLPRGGGLVVEVGRDCIEREHQHGTAPARERMLAGQNRIDVSANVVSLT
jgi:hypothetical protein